MQNLTLLGYALLGLLHGKNASGYDLRKVVSGTPMGRFSDSPGAIYPALSRLEERGFVRVNAMAEPSGRPRRSLRLTPAGLGELKRWLAAPVTQTDVASHMDALMLRFAFMDRVLGETATLAFLRSLHREFQVHVPLLTKYLEMHGADMPLSARLALQSGILGYEAQIQWTARAIGIYRRKVGRDERKRKSN
jgi:DNA-binding PadR family transcriptional regulator